MLNSVFFQKIWPAQLSLLQLSYKTRQMISWVVLTNFPTLLFQLDRLAQRPTVYSRITVDSTDSNPDPISLSIIHFTFVQWRRLSAKPKICIKYYRKTSKNLGEFSTLWENLAVYGSTENHFAKISYFWWCFLYVSTGKRSTKLELLHIIPSVLQYW